MEDFRARNEIILKGRIIKRGGIESIILPFELREGLIGATFILGLTQNRLAKDAIVSESLISNLFTGKLPVKSTERISRIAAVLERQLESKTDLGSLEGGMKKGIEATIQDFRSIFGLATNVPRYTEGANLVTGGRSQRLREKMVESMSLLLERNAQLTELVYLGITEESLMLAALRMTEMLSQTARVILEQHGDIFFPKGRDAESESERGR